MKTEYKFQLCQKGQFKLLSVHQYNKIIDELYNTRKSYSLNKEFLFEDNKCVITKTLMLS